MPDQADDLVRHFARLTAEVKFSDLPPAQSRRPSKASGHPRGKPGASGLERAVAVVLELAKENGGRAESTVIGAGVKLPASAAAFVNGAMAHCLDYDDYTHWGHHAASSIVPAAFAMAEKAGSVSGEDLITAVAIGQDIFGRLRRHVEWDQDWNLSPVMGVFAAAATASRIARPAARPDLWRDGNR